MASSAVSQLPNGGSALAALCLSLLIFFSLELNLANATHHPFSNLLLPSEVKSEGGLSDGAVSTCTKVDPSLNYSPVIGLLSQAGDGALGKLNNATGASHIPASFVKFVESAGARVIPLIYNEPEDVLEEKLSLVNGVIFIEGWGRYGLYYSVAGKIFKKILERNDGGDHVPLYGISQGFQVVSTLVLQDKTVVGPVDTGRFPNTLHFNDKADIKGTVFEEIPSDLRDKLSTDCIVWEDHIFGITLETFQKREALSKFFQVLTTGVDREGKVYVSTANAKNYPVTIFQWSPEKHAFEWGSPLIPHTKDAIEVTQKVANYLVSEARKSKTKPSEEKLRDVLIYNYNPVYGDKNGDGYDQVYIFE